MLVLERLTTTRGAFHLGPIDLTVGREVVAVLGPSGCGKTTLLKRVAGLASAGGGSVALNGRPLAARPPEARKIAMVFQESTAFPHMSVRRNIAYAAAAPRRVEVAAEQLEIDALLDRPARSLSGGERRRVEVARALAAAPDALLLDEPTTALDAPIKRRLRTRLRAVFTEFDIPVLYVTHDQEEAFDVADRVGLLRAGRLVQVGAPAQVYDHPASAFAYRFLGRTNALPGIMRGGRLEVAGAAFAVEDPALPEGTRAVGYSRPSRLSLQGERPHARPALAATVAHVSAAGPMARIALACEAAEDGHLEAQLAPNEHDRLDPQVGDVLYAAFPTLQVFAPPGG